MNIYDSWLQATVFKGKIFRASAIHGFLQAVCISSLFSASSWNFPFSPTLLNHLYGDYKNSLQQHYSSLPHSS